MIPENLLQSPAASQWQQIGIRHHHGICLPLFSLHSEKSCGIGEFYDLLPMIDWCKDVGMDVIQLLPLNDIGLGTSPYNAISAFALNPIHLSITELPGIETIPEYKEKLSKIGYWSRTLRVKYHIVRELKFAFLRDYFSRVYAELSQTPAYRNFVQENQFWLQSYALFKALKEINFWKNWEEWPTLMKGPSSQGYQDLLREHKDACDFHSFVQYLCFQQFERVKKYATEKGVFLKGDIPILISKDSADVWHNRHYFLHHLAAGAPPDMYSRDGQYWGFPIYDWEEMSKNDYVWWKQRLQLASHLYHLYRIDHVVGFFRIWAIGPNKPAREGSFLPADSAEWIPQGRKLMEMMLTTAPILPIGEDLGLVPDEVKECLHSLGICGTKVMRWERRWNEDGGFIPVEAYPAMTMTTVSTHDSDTLQLWWRHFPKEAKLFADYKGWPYTPFLTSEYQEQILRDSHHSGSLFHINLLQEYLALFPELVSQNPHNERINIPGKVLDTNWTYRFKPSVERIIEHIPLREKMRSILKP
ncbi:4-alpha-glucanotransferase [Chlamydiota bacterium]